MKDDKKRLDHILVERYPHYSRRQWQEWIQEGAVLVDGDTVVKSSYLVPSTSTIQVCIEKPKYVSRAGFKLEKALTYFGIDVRGLIALDAGLSTGGFTDCLLQRDVKKVYGVDVGHNQAHNLIRSDSRVIVMENTNIKELPELGEHVDLVTLDLSFISVLKIIFIIQKIMRPSGRLIVLIKPQFEVGRQALGAGGIVKKEREHMRAVTLVKNGIEAAGFIFMGVIESPITGTDGNKEFLAYFIKQEGD